jgi:hypothetical protein
MQCLSSDPELVEETIAAVLQGSSPDSRSRPVEDEFLARLQTVESRAIAEYIAEADNLLKLSDDIQACDGLLESLEHILSSYDERLDGVTDEILGYQRRCDKIFEELRDKRELRDEVSTFVESLILKPKLIRDLTTLPVNDHGFAEALSEFDGKLTYINGSESVRNSPAYRDVAIGVEKLRLVAVKRGRDFLLERIYELRHPKSNIQVQQNALVKYMYVIQFLRDHGRNVFEELRAEYKSNVSAKFMEVFKSYWATLEGMQILNPGILLGSNQSSGYYSYFESFFEGHDEVKDAQEEYFELKDRLENSRRQVNQPPIMPSDSNSAEEPFERIFASLSRLLVDTAAHEYLFCKNFWQSEGRQVFKDTFKPILDFIHGSLQASLQDQEDIIAILLCINNNRENFLLMTKRRNPALDEHFDAVNLLLWPRVKIVLDRHLHSVMELDTEDGVKLRKNEILPVTRRYACMMTSMLVIMEIVTDGSISLNIEQLSYTLLNYLLKFSRRFTKSGEGTVFLLHNLHHVNSVLRKAGKAQPSFQEAFSRALNLYIDTNLVPRVGGPRAPASRTAPALRKEIQKEFKLQSLADIVEDACMPKLCEY